MIIILHKRSLWCLYDLCPQPTLSRVPQPTLSRATWPPFSRPSRLTQSTLDFFKLVGNLQVVSSSPRRNVPISESAPPYFVLHRGANLNQLFCKFTQHQIQANTVPNTTVVKYTYIHSNTLNYFEIFWSFALHKSTLFSQFTKYKHSFSHLIHPAHKCL